MGYYFFFFTVLFLTDQPNGSLICTAKYKTELFFCHYIIFFISFFWQTCVFRGKVSELKNVGVRVSVKDEVDFVGINCRAKNIFFFYFVYMAHTLYYMLKREDGHNIWKKKKLAYGIRKRKRVFMVLPRNRTNVWWFTYI